MPATSDNPTPSTTTSESGIIRITPHQGHVRVKMMNRYEFDVAVTDRALALEEGDYPTVYYIPREDVEMEYLGRTEKTTHCPHKGDASYYSVFRDGELAENGVWSYESPKTEVRRIEGYLAFDPKQFEIQVDQDIDVSRERRTD